MIEETLNNHELAALLNARRISRGLTIRKAANEAKVSPATFWRAEQGEAPKDLDVFRRLCLWLEIPLSRLIGSRPAHPGIARDSIQHSKSESTLEMIEAHLRADGTLDPQTVKMMTETFRTMYDLARRTPGRKR